MWRKIFLTLFFFFLVGSVALAGVGMWGYYYITRDLPKLSTIADYRPAAVSSVFANDGTLVAEFFKQRRYPVKIKEIPEMVRRCFLAAEDASFYEHKGIDYVSILRAIRKNLETGSFRQGGSTITQQVVKNLLLSSERSLLRKAKEAILSFQLEKRFTKDEIFEMYLNEIFLGNNAYGIKAAARAYYRKELDQLTLAEAAILAGLPKAPSRFSPLTNMTAAKNQQRYVLQQMKDAGWATEAEVKAALAEKIKVYPSSLENIFRTPFFVTEVRRIMESSERWKGYDIDADGLQIYTTVDVKADTMATRALRKGLREVDKRRGWRGPLRRIEGATPEEFVRQFASSIPEVVEYDTVYPALVTAVRGKSIKVDLGQYTAELDLAASKWGRRRLGPNERVTSASLEDAIKPGDVIEVTIQPPESDPAMKGEESTENKPAAWEPQLADIGRGRVVLDQTPDIEGSLVLLDPHSGRVLTTIGGYSYQRSQFNRVTQALRQPGSTFKPIVYLAAVDGFRYTPATIVHDTPRTFKAGDELWTPSNFDEEFLGPITLRTALEKSRNLVSADIVSQIGIDAVIQYAKRLGVESKLGRNLSLSLGSSEVTMLELARAYGVFPAKGVLFDSVFITKVVDRDGNVLFDEEKERLAGARQAIPETSAFIMANMMKGVVEHGTGFRVKELRRPAAGKTGTSNDQMDTWFVGYTPSWVCGVWVGFDQKKTIGNKETGGRVAAPLFVYFMQDFLKHQEQAEYAKLEQEAQEEARKLGVEYVAPDPIVPLDFTPPVGVEPFWVSKANGVEADGPGPGVIQEFFAEGTRPNRSVESTEATNSYLESPEL